MAQGGKTHKLMASPQTTHTGFFDGTIPPVLTIKSGDTVIMNSMMLMEGQLRCGMTLEELIATRKGYTDRQVGPHTLTGPIFLKGAEPGDVLEVRIKKLVPADCGVNYHFPGRMNIGGLPEDFPVGQIKTLKLDTMDMKTTFAPGVVIPLKPFFGVMGVAPKPGEKKPDPRKELVYSSAWSCKEQFESGLIHFVTRIRDRRFVAVDRERGIVYSFGFFDHAAGKSRYFKSPDGRDVVAGPTEPWTWQIAELFKVEKGKIRRIEAVLQRCPYGMNSGWSTYEKGMSDEIQIVK